MVLSMARTLTYKPVYVDWKTVTGTTVPGRCYSVAELLLRTVRNQPLPVMNIYQEKDDGKNSPQDIDAAIEAAENHPFFDRDADEIEASNFIDSVNAKENEKVD